MFMIIQPHSKNNPSDKFRVVRAVAGKTFLWEKPDDSTVEPY